MNKLLTRYCIYDIIITIKLVLKPANLLLKKFLSQLK
jgi:hypothetical protein